MIERFRPLQDTLSISNQIFCDLWLLFVEKSEVK